MAKRILAIGVGGTGKAALTIFRERLEETYGEVPDNVVLLSLDTDSLRDIDQFAGTQLNPAFDDRGRPPEFQAVVAPLGMKMDTIFADIRSGKTKSYMYWLEHEKLDRILGPAERDIRGGAQQRRPIGRTALFLRYSNPVTQSIIDAIELMYGEPEEDEDQSNLDATDIEKGKRLIFIVGSVAGGTGSGMMIDVANLVRHIVDQNQSWQSVSVSAVIVLPDAFASYTRFMDDPTNLKPNSYAALRELDRFTRVHSSFLPYMIRYSQSLQSITWSSNQPVDHIYLVDTASRSGSQDFDLSGDPMKGIFPEVADFLMAHTDNSLGDALATLRSNAGLHYDKSAGRMYSSFNVTSYIFPVDDVIESFSYQFLRQLLHYVFLPIDDEKKRSQLLQQAAKEVETKFTGNAVEGKQNPTIIQKSIVATRRIEPETPDMSWQGLFSLISLSDSQFADDYQFLQTSLDYLAGNMILSREGDYKKESFDEGAARLQRLYEQFLDDYLGPKVDPDDESSRFGGDWDKVLGQYQEALQVKFAEALDAALLEILNRRDDRKMLYPHRQPQAIFTVKQLKAHLVAFKKLLEGMWKQQQVDARIRQVGEGVRNSLTWMNETRYSKYFPPFKTEPKQAQDSFRNQVLELMYLTLHQRVYHTALQALDALGAAEKDSDGKLSVLDAAMLELENWQLTMNDVDQLVAKASRQHESNRAEKRRVKVRKYLTDKAFEATLYAQPPHAPAVMTRVMGQISNEKGLEWQRKSDLAPLDYKLVTTWGEEAQGAEAIFKTWFKGTKELFGAVRDNVTVAERLASSFRSHSSFTNKALQVEEPYLRYNPSVNDVPMFKERYVSFNINKARDDTSRQFLTNARNTLADQGFNVDSTAESLVACTVVEISRGVKLDAVEAFTQCEPEYRSKLYRGRESIHLFPEEQQATDWEKSIPTLSETENRLRAISPELVVAIGDPIKVKAFTLASAYGLVYEDAYYDSETGQESTELWLKLNDEHSIPLSQSAVVRELENNFGDLPISEQIARLYLNALQNFTLKITQPPGYSPQMVEHIKAELVRRGVPLGGIENPFDLPTRSINDAINNAVSSLGANGDGQKPSRAQNARVRVKKLEAFLDGEVAGFKSSPDRRIKDLGTVMHLILREEINRLKQVAKRGN